MDLKIIKPEIKETFLLALPMAGSQLAQVLMGVTDNIVVGSLGTDAVAALGLALSSFYPLMVLGMGCLLAINPMTAQVFGAGKTNEIGVIVRTGLQTVLIVGLPIVFILGFSNLFLELLGQNKNISNQASQFLDIFRWSVLSTLGFIALRGALEGTSLARPGFVISVLGIFLNLILNLGLVNGQWGFPRLGFMGSAYATLSVQALMFIALLGYTLYQKEWRNYIQYTQLFTFDWAVFKDLLRIGLPIGISLFIEVVLFAGTAFMMGTLGKVELAANQIAINCASVTFMMALGIALATTTRVGQAIGRGEPHVARRAGYMGMVLGCLVMGILGLVFLFFPKVLVGFYLDLNAPENTQTITLAIKLLLIASLFQVFDALQVTASGAMRGIKQTILPMFLGLIGYWGIGISSGYLLCFVFGWGAEGLWYGETLGLGTTGILLFFAFRNYFKRIFLKPSNP